MDTRNVRLVVLNTLNRLNTFSGIRLIKRAIFEPYFAYCRRKAIVTLARMQPKPFRVFRVFIPFMNEI